MLEYTTKDIERFWSKVDKSGGEDSCWEWKARRVPGGYGQFRYGSRVDPNRKQQLLPSNRVAWNLTFGEIPEGLFVCHSCDNPPCCNPKHLWLGTPLENVEDMIKKGRHASRTKMHGEKHPNHKLTIDDVSRMCDLYTSGDWSQRRLGKEFGVSNCLVNRIVNGLAWRFRGEP